MSLFKNLFGKRKQAELVEQQKSETVKEVIKLIGCEYEQIDLNLNAEEITELYIKAYSDGKKSGYTPIILVVNDTLLETIQINYEDNNGAENFRSKLLSADISHGKEILKERFEWGLPEEPDEDFDIYGDFDDSIKPDAIFMSLDKKLLDKDAELLMFKIPTDKSWEVFAWIPFGGWNECPDEEDAMSVCKYWHDLYGAVPAVITSDILQMYVPNPVEDKDTAIKLAEEQFSFCTDIVYQGIGDIKSLASSLINSSVWYFWWD